jgi:hypothetical protein
MALVLSSGPGEHADPIGFSRDSTRILRTLALLWLCGRRPCKHPLAVPKNTSSRAKARQRVSTKDRQGKGIV